jgi:peptide/nickel transport system ATP-binding protein
MRNHTLLQIKNLKTYFYTSDGVVKAVFTIGAQVAEAIQLHQKLNKKAALEKSIEMLKLVGIPSPEKRVKEYPYELSGGMKQRAMIAMAMTDL